MCLPTDPTRTAIILNANPNADALHPDAIYRLNIDNDGDCLTDVAISYVFSQPHLRTLTTWISVGNLFSSAMFALLVVYLVRGLHLGAATIGWLLAVINLGFIAPAPPNRRPAPRFRPGAPLTTTMGDFSA